MTSYSVPVHPSAGGSGVTEWAGQVADDLALIEQALPVVAGGLNGAVTPARFAGGTVSGAPVTGTFDLADFVVDQAGAMWACTAAGSPGSWVQVGAGGGGAMTNPMTTAGDLIKGGSGGTPGRVAIGTPGQALAVSGGGPAWKDCDQINVVTVCGADPTGAADSTTAIGNAIAAWVLSGRPVYFPAGTYKITATLNWKITGLVVRGAGSSVCAISMATANTPILQVAGSYQEIGGITFTYATQQSTSNTSAFAMELGDDSAGSCFQSWFHDIQLLKSYTGMVVSPAITTVAGLFSCLFQDITVSQYAEQGISLVASNGNGANATGCVFTNIYVANLDNAAASWPVFLEYWDEVTFHQLNVEHVSLAGSDAIALVNVGNAVLAGVHFEEVTQTGNTYGLIYVSASTTASKVTCYGVTSRFNVFSGSASNCVFRTFGTNGVSIAIDGFLEDSSITRTTPARYAVNFNSATGVVAYLRSFDTSGITAQSAGASTGDVIAQFNGTYAAAGLTGAVAASRYAGATTSGAPVSGIFLAGDFVITQDGHIFICTTAGSPGTWANAGASSGVSTFNSRSGAVVPGNADYLAVASGGLTGATTATRYAGATSGGAPGSGTFATGDFIVDVTGKIFICTAGGSPGTWVNAGSLYALLSGATMTGYLAPAVVTLSAVSNTVAVNAALGNDFRLTLTSSSWTISNPTNPVDGERIDFQLQQDSTGGRTVAWGTAYDFGTAGAPTLTTTASKGDVLGFVYYAASSKWRFLGSLGGYS